VSLGDVRSIKLLPQKTELGVGQPPGSSHIFNERQQFPANADFKLLSFLSVGTKQQSRLRYWNSLMSIPFRLQSYRGAQLMATRRSIH
jgi:hypothetical protein